MPVKIERPCHAIVSTFSDFEPMSEMQFRQEFEKGDEKKKCACMRNLIIQMQNGEKFPNLLMTIIRFVMPVQNNLLKKLLMIYWEMVNKHGPDGKLLHEMILVCDTFRRDLIHPNEFVRGATLRFLCRLKEPDILAPLIPVIRTCLEHRIPYVRRNAICTILFTYQNYPHLILDAVDVIINFLDAELDNSCRRNAFLALLKMDEQAALDYVERKIDSIQTFGDTLQLIIVDFIRTHCICNADDKERYIGLLYNLMETGNTSVRFECASALMSLSNASAVKISAQCYIDIGSKESDNNIKLVILDQLIKINERFAGQNVLQDLVVDIFNIMDSPDIDVTEKTVHLLMDLITVRNISEIMRVSRRALTRTYSTVEESVSEKKRKLIVMMLHQCSIKYPDISKECSLMLLDLLPQFASESAMAVLMFVRMTMVEYGDSAKSELLTKLLEALRFLEDDQVVKEAIWLLAEFSTTFDELNDSFNLLKQLVGSFGEENEAEEETEQTLKTKTAPLLNEDGSYASQSAYTNVSHQTTRECHNIEALLKNIKIHFGLAVAVTTALCKFILRLKLYHKCNPAYEQITKTICVKFLELADDLDESNRTVNMDEYDRIQLCLKIIEKYDEKVAQMFESGNRTALVKLVKEQRNNEQRKLKQLELDKMTVDNFDEPITFDLILDGLDNSNGIASSNDEVKIDWIERVIRSSKHETKQLTDCKNEFANIHQLSGLSDPVYVECTLDVSNFVIGLDILLINRTAETLQNVTIEIATLGDLKVVEKPSSITMSSGDQANLTAHIKVNSTENAVIHGNVTYDLLNGKTEYVMLSELKIDVLEYIKSDQSMNSEQFRSMWVKFEWENKITVNTPCTKLKRYVELLRDITGMSLLQSENVDDLSNIERDSGFLSANLYGQTVFREDILANVSIELSEKGTIEGHVRIRAKTQGMALSMGEKITSGQKTFL